MEVILRYCQHCDGTHEEKGKYIDNGAVIKGNIIKKHKCISCGELSNIYLIHIPDAGFSYTS